MSIVERGFDVRDHEIIQRVYQAAWARLPASKPVRTLEEESLRLQLREPFRSLLERFVRPVAEEHSKHDGEAPGQTGSRTLLENGSGVEGAAR